MQGLLFNLATKTADCLFLQTITILSPWSLQLDICTCIHTHTQRFLSQHWKPWPRIFQRHTVSDRQGPVLPLTLQVMAVKVGVGMRRHAGDGGNPSLFFFFFLPLPQIPKHTSQHRSRPFARAADSVTSNMAVISLSSSGETPLSTSWT